MKALLFWILAIIITLAAVIYQRKTGPTYDKQTEVAIGNTTYKFKLVRSHGGESDCKVELNIPDKEVEGKIYYKRFPTNEGWAVVQMDREGDNLKGFLPHQPPAGKLEYKVELVKHGEAFMLNNGIPVVIRFKGAVPGAVLVPHVLFIFIAMLLGNLSGIMAIFRHKKFRLYARFTLLFLAIGGMFLGPWVQWHAFGEAWAGVPFAWDLTDNKTLVSFIFWIIAVLTNHKKERPAYVVVASIVMLIIYAIPHSMYGSQLDPETGEIIQGWVRLIR